MVLTTTLFYFPQAIQAKVEHLSPTPKQIDLIEDNSFTLNRTITISDPTDSTEKAKGIYNLQGVKLNSASSPGFYIIDSEKVIVK